MRSGKKERGELVSNGIYVLFNEGFDEEAEAVMDMEQELGYLRDTLASEGYNVKAILEGREK